MNATETPSEGAGVPALRFYEILGAVLGGMLVVCLCLALVARVLRRPYDRDHEADYYSHAYSSSKTEHDRPTNDEFSDYDYDYDYDSDHDYALDDIEDDEYENDYEEEDIDRNHDSRTSAFEWGEDNPIDEWIDEGDEPGEAHGENALPRETDPGLIDCSRHNEDNEKMQNPRNLNGAVYEKEDIITGEDAIDLDKSEDWSEGTTEDESKLNTGDKAEESDIQQMGNGVIDVHSRPQEALSDSDSTFEEIQSHRKDGPRLSPVPAANKKKSNLKQRGASGDCDTTNEEIQSQQRDNDVIRIPTQPQDVPSDSDSTFEEIQAHRKDGPRLSPVPAANKKKSNRKHSPGIQAPTITKGNKNQAFVGVPAKDISKISATKLPQPKPLQSRSNSEDPSNKSQLEVINDKRSKLERTPWRSIMPESFEAAPNKTTASSQRSPLITPGKIAEVETKSSLIHENAADMDAFERPDEKMHAKSDSIPSYPRRGIDPPQKVKQKKLINSVGKAAPKGRMFLENTPKNGRGKPAAEDTASSLPEEEASSDAVPHKDSTLRTRNRARGMEPPQGKRAYNYKEKHEEKEKKKSISPPGIVKGDVGDVMEFPELDSELPGKPSHKSPRHLEKISVDPPQRMRSSWRSKKIKSRRGEDSGKREVSPKGALDLIDPPQRRRSLRWIGKKHVNSDLV